jgi:sRNA-binding carbon storage regulator CsrA
VTEVRGGRVRLSIEAPQAVRIARQEILQAPQSTVPAAPATVPRDIPAG